MTLDTSRSLGRELRRGARVARLTSPTHVGCPATKPFDVGVKTCGIEVLRQTISRVGECFVRDSPSSVHARAHEEPNAAQFRTRTRDEFRGIRLTVPVIRAKVVNMAAAKTIQAKTLWRNGYSGLCRRLTTRALMTTDKAVTLRRTACSPSALVGIL